MKRVMTSTTIEYGEKRTSKGLYLRDTDTDAPSLLNTTAKESNSHLMADLRAFILNGCQILLKEGRCSFARFWFSFFLLVVITFASYFFLYSSKYSLVFLFLFLILSYVILSYKYLFLSFYLPNKLHFVSMMNWRREIWVRAQ